MLQKHRYYSRPSQYRKTDNYDWVCWCILGFSFLYFTGRVLVQHIWGL